MFKQEGQMRPVEIDDFYQPGCFMTGGLNASVGSSDVRSIRFDGNGGVRSNAALADDAKRLISILRDETNSASVYARCVAIVGERQP